MIRGIVSVVLAAMLTSVTITGAPAVAASTTATDGSSTVAAASPPASWCRNQPQLQLAPKLAKDPDRDAAGQPIAITPGLGGRYVPVLVVHGIWGSDVHSNARTGAFSHKIDLTANRAGSVDARTSVIGQFQDIPGAAVFTFDYSAVNTHWITNQQIAPALGAAIDCLASSSGQKVIVVAHSMGGLAARLAITPPNGPSRASEVGQVITFGTPELGSWLAALGFTLHPDLVGRAAVAGVSSQQVGLLQELAALCRASDPAPGSVPSSLCDLLASGDRYVTDGTTALATGSAAIAALPPWPRSVPVHALAGSVNVQPVNGGWFRLIHSASTSFGDGLVSTASAAAGSTTSERIDCDYTLDADQTGDDILTGLHLLAAQSQAVPVRQFSTQACAHWDLLESIELTNDALGYVNDGVTGELGAAYLQQPDAWKVTFAGIGPAMLDGALPDVRHSVVGSPYVDESDCPGPVYYFASPGRPSLWVSAADDASGRTARLISLDGTAADYVVPRGPATEAGIAVGSSVAELKAAYPQLQHTGTDPDTYALTDGHGRWIDFALDIETDSHVSLVTVSHSPQSPYEFCG